MNTDIKWWQKSVIYQIYPKSFNDTTGNGTGDINGIIEKLDYLKLLGVDVLWLTPIYKSPQVDNGYDISDYYNIYEDYGTFDDFQRLLDEAHARDIKIIMDIVVNHTSTEHNWFEESRKSKDNPYRDFYIWKDPVDGKEPTNWQSKFGGNAWKYDEQTGQYYLHLFDVKQADLNWENEKVRHEVYKMINWWFEKGIDGFRFDVINLISKNQNFPNEDGSPSRFVPDGRKFYTDGPRIHEFLQEMNKEVLSKGEILTVGEMSSTNLENCVKYSNLDGKELSMIFSFHHLKVDYPNGEKWAYANFDFVKLKSILSEWQIGMYQNNAWNALFWCNHDQPRAISRFGDDKNYPLESAKMLATTLHMLQGSPYIYQGEEIGMTNPNFENIEEYKDVESINAYNLLKEKGLSDNEIMKIIKQKSRDNSRTPMQWDDNKNSGFTSGTPWINVASNYKNINAKKVLEDKNSIFYHYKKLIDLRKKYDIITTGEYKDIDLNNPNIYSYLRDSNNETLLVISNFYGKEAEFQTNEINFSNSEILISNYNDTLNTPNSLKLRPYESVVFLLKK